MSVGSNPQIVIYRTHQFKKTRDYSIHRQYVRYACALHRERTGTPRSTGALHLRACVVRKERFGKLRYWPLWNLGSNHITIGYWFPAEMEGGPWESIRRNYTFLSNKLYLSEELLRLLYQEEFIGRGDLERLRNVHELNSSRLSNLLDLLLHQRDDKFDPFCRCLRRVGQGHIADVLMDQGGQTQGSGQTSRAQAASCRVPDGRTGVQSGTVPIYRF